MRVKTARQSSGLTRHIIIEGNHNDRGTADITNTPISLEATELGEQLYNILSTMDYRVFRVLARHFMQWGIASAGVIRETDAWPGRLRTINDPSSREELLNDPRPMGRGVGVRND